VVTGGDSGPTHAQLPHMSKLSVLLAVVRRSGPHLIEATVIPTALFYACLVTAGIGTALVVALAWAYGAVILRVAQRRPVPPILLLAVIGLTVRTLVAVATGSTFVYFVQPVLGTVAMAAAFVLSIVIGRPLIASLALEFWPVTPEMMSRPAVLRLFRGLTWLWAAVNLFSAGLTFTLLVSLPLSTFVAIRQVSSLCVTSVGVLVTITLSLRTARREGLMAPLPVPA
jgi:hypothetical protein